MPDADATKPQSEMEDGVAYELLLTLLEYIIPRSGLVSH